MGFTKRYLEQLEEESARGYSAPERGDRFLCTSHYSDEYLNAFIQENGVEGVCSYCGRRGRVIDFSDFVEHVGSKLSEHLEQIDDAGLFLESTIFDDDDEVVPGITRRDGFAAPEGVPYYNDFSEMMWDFDLVSDSEELNNDLSNSMLFERRIRRDPMAMLLSEELSMMWRNFCDFVKTRQRFTFFKSWLFDEGMLEQSDNGLGDILSELGGLVHRVEATIEVGTALYRCRPANPDETVASFEDITAPPASAAKSNRLSPAGISMFYGSFDKDTPIAEVGYAVGKPIIYLGAFKTTKPLRVIDLCSDLHVSFWMQDGWQEASFLMHFHNEISKKIGPKDNGEVEYVPTQIFTEYLRYLCKASDGTQYDGIIYKSATTGRRNVVLFYDQKTSESVLSLDGQIEKLEKRTS